MVIKLNVPYSEKEHAKQLGAKWDPIYKKWFIPLGTNTSPFKKWLPQDIIVDTKIEYSTREEPSLRHLSLSNYLFKVNEVIRQAPLHSHWVNAEISELRNSQGHIFLTLVEYDNQQNLVARTRCSIWKSQANTILTKFEEGAKCKLEVGIKVLLFIRADFHSLYGFNLTVHDIDPIYTVGDMVEKIAKIRKILLKDKLLTKNKQLSKPKDFVNIAVISPNKAAGLGDFNREALILSNNNLCAFKHYTALFQGLDAPMAISETIEQVIIDCKNKKFDALVIIRGGGAASDLGWLNDENLARKICLCPIPVMVGIGHERDFTILNEIASETFDTPSKVINHIFTVVTKNGEEASKNYKDILKLSKNYYSLTLEKINNIKTSINNSIDYSSNLFYQNTTNYYKKIIEIGSLRITQLNKELMQLQFQIESSAISIYKIKNNELTRLQHETLDLKKNVLQRMDKQISEQIIIVYKILSRNLNEVEKKLENTIREILSRNPIILQKQGFTIIHKRNGGIITSAKDAKLEKYLDIEFHDGKVPTEVKLS